MQRRQLYLVLKLPPKLVVQSGAREEWLSAMGGPPQSHAAERLFLEVLAKYSRLGYLLSTGSPYRFAQRQNLALSDAYKGGPVRSHLLETVINV